MHDDVLQALDAAPDVLAEVLESLPEAAWTRRPSEDAWSIAEVVGHVRAADLIWSPRILVALVHDGASFPDVDERALQAVLEAGGTDAGDQVTAFAFGRAELCAALRALPDDGWSRTFTHPTSGRIAVLAACTMVAAHEAEHLDQVRQVAAAIAEAQ